MRTLSLVVLIALALAGCSSCKGKKVATPSERKLFKHRDFDFLIPENWTFLEKESAPDTMGFQDSNGASRVTISLMYYEPGMPDVELEATFKRYVEVRRKAEKDITPSPVLTDCAIKKEEGYWYTKCAAYEKTEDHRSATLVTAENGKLLTVYVETIGTDDAFLSTLANDVFSNLDVK